MWSIGDVGKIKKREECNMIELNKYVKVKKQQRSGGSTSNRQTIDAQGQTRKGTK